MSDQTYSVNALCGRHVCDRADGKRIGKVHSFVFHPSKRVVVGFTVKRPDVAWMFHRKDLFVAFDDFELRDGKLYVADDDATTGKAACKRLGISWDDCILWQGLPLLTEAGVTVGHVGDVTFDAATGNVVSLNIDQGSTRNALLGVASLDASQVKGFRFGVGENLGIAEDGDFLTGALIVSDDALDSDRTGGLAEKAGSATAVASYKASVAAAAAKPKFEEAAETAKEAAANAKERATQAWNERPSGEEATARAGEAIEEGALKLGKQAAKARGMFASFKQNYKAALSESASSFTDGKPAPNHSTKEDQ